MANRNGRLARSDRLGRRRVALIEARAEIRAPVGRLWLPMGALDLRNSALRASSRSRNMRPKQSSSDPSDPSGSKARVHPRSSEQLEAARSSSKPVALADFRQLGSSSATLASVEELEPIEQIDSGSKSESESNLLI